MSANKYSKQDCIDALRKAEEKIGDSPTAEQYRQLDLNPTYSVFYDKFDSWNSAKKEAGLEEYSPGRSISHKPKIVGLSDEEWENLSPQRRHKLRRWSKLQRIKVEQGCANCGYDEHPSALEFHHRNKSLKEFEVSRGFISRKKSWDEIKEEIKKCDVLCSNCHRIEESSWPQD